MLEVLIAGSIAILVFGTTLYLFFGGQRMTSASQLSMAVQSTLLFHESLSHELKHLGTPFGSIEPIRVSRHAVTFYRTVFEEGVPGIHLRAVRFSTVPSPGGNLNLKREDFEGSKIVDDHILPDVTLERLTFVLVPNPEATGRFLLATGTVLSDDLPQTHFWSRKRVKRFPVVFLGEIRDPPFVSGQLASSAEQKIDGPLPAVTEEPP